MQKWMTLTLATLTGLVVACGTGCSESRPVTAMTVIDKFNEAGLNLSEIKDEVRDPGSVAPNSFKENKSFAVPEVAPKGGQIFVCDTKKNCDALYAYYDALKMLAGPYLYQSKDGVVVIQLNRGMTPDTAAKFEKVINSL